MILLDVGCFLPVDGPELLTHPFISLGEDPTVMVLLVDRSVLMVLPGVRHPFGDIHPVLQVTDLTVIFRNTWCELLQEYGFVTDSSHGGSPRVNAHGALPGCPSVYRGVTADAYQCVIPPSGREHLPADGTVGDGPL